MWFTQYELRAASSEYADAISCPSRCSAGSQHVPRLSRRRAWGSSVLWQNLSPTAGLLRQPPARTHPSLARAQIFPGLQTKPAFHTPPAFCHFLCALRSTFDDKTSQPRCETLNGIVTFCCSHRANVSPHLLPKNSIYHSGTGRPLSHLSRDHISGCHVKNLITNRLLFYRSPCFHHSNKN